MIRLAAAMRRCLLLVIAVAALGVSGCGDKEQTITAGESEAAYVTLGDLQYQVQISRQLNPRDVEDRAYLTGIAPDQARLRPGESWFGVFLLVQNENTTTRFDCELAIMISLDFGTRATPTFCAPCAG